MTNKEDFGKYHDFTTEVLEYMKITAGTMNIELTPEYANNVLECAININCLDNNLDLVKEYQTCAIAASFAKALFKDVMGEGEKDA